jgi:hypothetical protein
MLIHLHIIGTLLIVLACLHLVLPRYFHWKQELSGLSIMNRQMMYVHSFFIAFVVFLIGLLCVTSSVPLISTPLGQRIALALAIFWGARLFVQFFGYSPKIWRGKTFETAIHILAVLFWTYVTVVFALIYLRAWADL